MATAFTHINGRNFIPAPHRSSLRRRSGGLLVRAVSTGQKSPYWASIDDDIQAHLRLAIPLREPFSVFEPMRHLTFSAPETTAPALCIAACELLGGRRDQAIAAASALHLMHAASHVHQRIPLTDRPSPNPNPPPGPGPAFGPNIELLTGDGMIPFGFELLANSEAASASDDVRSGRILQVIIEITRAIGSQGGQYHGTGNGSPRGEGGGLHACGAACGAILGGGNEAEVEKLRNYGFYAGKIQKMWKTEGAERHREAREEMRRLALEELEHFDGAKVEAIFSFVNYP